MRDIREGPARSLVGSGTGDAERAEVLECIREALHDESPGRQTLEACGDLLKHLAGRGEWVTIPAVPIDRGGGTAGGRRRCGRRSARRYR